MRIAQVAPLYEAVPPQAYGGTERVVAALCNGLVARGHDVTLFASGGSSTDAKLEPVVPRPIRLGATPEEMVHIAPHHHLRMLSEVYRREEEFDVIHAHTGVWALPFTDLARTPTLHTLHGRLDYAVDRKVLPLYRHAPLVSISNSQRRPVAHLPLRWAGTAYNGLELDSYSIERGSGDYLAYIGRITPEKRPDWAVEVAERAGLPLRVAAKVDPLDVEYWETEIRPLFEASDVEFIGEITEAEKPEFYAGAAALVFPIDWPEPFGLVMVESLAAGTPVIALNRGSVPEVIEHGRSGFVCNDVDEMVAAIGRLDTLDPE
ncbi:MAG: glycosyltransferase family 4 protein, partial [Acidimicrobiia bacterium]|nr:glycosyltransferase family 4 protein [Acidimicrobiia bacterium]